MTYSLNGIYYTVSPISSVYKYFVCYNWKARKQCCTSYCSCALVVIFYYFILLKVLNGCNKNLNEIGLKWINRFFLFTFSKKQTPKGSLHAFMSKTPSPSPPSSPSASAWSRSPIVSPSSPPLWWNRSTRRTCPSQRMASDSKTCTLFRWTHPYRSIAKVWHNKLKPNVQIMMMNKK